MTKAVPTPTDSISSSTYARRRALANHLASLTNGTSGRHGPRPEDDRGFGHPAGDPALRNEVGRFVEETHAGSGTRAHGNATTSYARRLKDMPESSTSVRTPPGVRPAIWPTCSWRAAPKWSRVRPVCSAAGCGCVRRRNGWPNWRRRRRNLKRSWPASVSEGTFIAGWVRHEHPVTTGMWGPFAVLPIGHGTRSETCVSDLRAFWSVTDSQRWFVLVGDGHRSMDGMASIAKCRGLGWDPVSAEAG